jgi:4-amino-4-deoxy-L-arabinose transferase-like glycosyltransferase
VFVANCLKKGDFISAFDYLNLNVYPAILLGLDKLGFDWIIGGKLWGAVIASVTVLPMFGWVRRLFDDRVAAMAGFLYAVHPHLIEVSVEPIREATFWFFLTLSLYLIWRSIDELRIHHFVLAGSAVALALHTRIEGWALFVPLAIWGVHRWRQLEDNRRRFRLAFGTLALVAVTPLLIVAVNTTVLRNHVQWEYGRLNHFSLIGSWMRVLGLPKSDPQLADQPQRLNKQLAAVTEAPPAAPLPVTAATVPSTKPADVPAAAKPAALSRPDFRNDSPSQIPRYGRGSM